MRKIDLKFEPPKVQISQQEIMDDLRYPVAPERRRRVVDGVPVRFSAGAPTG